MTDSLTGKDGDEFRTAGHQLIELIADYLDGVEERPLFPRITPEEVDALFDEALPQKGRPVAEVLLEVEQKLIPFCAHVNHPGYMGLITPTPTPIGILGDLLASALNQNLGAWTIGPSATAMERRVVRWLTDMVGFGTGAGGNLTSGGTMANFIALKLARDHVSGEAAQQQGLREPWAVYTSEERHVSVDKAVDAVGLGREALRPLPTNACFELRLDALEQAIAQDRAAGIRPLCLVGLAGTTNTGSVDDLQALRRIASREGMWLHVDACYGGGMLLSHQHPGLLPGLEQADSVALDPHKWFYAPLDVGAVLVRDSGQLTRSFGLRPAYLTDELDLDQERYAYYVHGFEQSRRFRSLKVWMSFKRYGAEAIGAWIDANVAHARRLHDLAEQHPKFESATRPCMSAVCIRYLGADGTGKDAERLHQEIARRVEQSGRFWISTTRLKGRTWFRINPVNFRTRVQHMNELFEFLAAECLAAHDP